jgi:hypothetical protein
MGDIPVDRVAARFPTRSRASHAAGDRKWWWSQRADSRTEPTLRRERPGQPLKSIHRGAERIDVGQRGTARRARDGDDLNGKAVWIVPSTAGRRIEKKSPTATRGGNAWMGAVPAHAEERRAR